MKITSFDPAYHIGIKVNPTMHVSTLRQKIIPKFKETEFSNVAPERLPSNVKHEIEVLANDGTVKIEINYQLNALNTEGEDSESTTKTFEKLLSILKELNYEIKGFSTSIDIVTNVIVSTDKVPTKLINDSVKCNLEPWRELNPNTNVNGLKINLIDEEYAKQSLTLLVGPSSLSPTTAIVVSIRYLTLEPDLIIDFGKKLNQRLIKFLESLGGE